MGLTRLIPAWPATFTALSRAFQFGEAAGPNLEGPARVTVAPFRTDPTQVVRRNRRAGCAAPRTHAFFKVADGVVSSRTLVKRPRAESLRLRIDGEPRKPRLLSVWATSTIKGLLAAPPRLGVDASAVATQGGLTGALGRSSSGRGPCGLYRSCLAEGADRRALIARAR